MKTPNCPQSHLREIRAHMNSANNGSNPFLQDHARRMAIYHLGGIDGYCAAVRAWEADWYMAAKNEAHFLMYSYRKDSK